MKILDAILNTDSNKIVIIIFLSTLISCAQHSAPTETSIKLSSYGISNLMTNANHIIVGGIKENEDGKSMHWIESIDPSKLTFSKDLDQGQWFFFGRMFIDNVEHCATSHVELNQETQKIALDFSKSECKRSPIASTGINHGVFHFCADIEDEYSCTKSKTKSFQIKLLKVSQSSTQKPNTDSSNIYFTSNCYEVKNGSADILTPFHFQEDSDLPTVGEMILYSGKGCNGKTQRIEFNHFLIANNADQVRRELQEKTATFYIKDNTLEISKDEMNYLASIDTEEIEIDFIKDEEIVSEENIEDLEDLEDLEDMEYVDDLEDMEYVDDLEDMEDIDDVEDVEIASVDEDEIEEETLSIEENDISDLEIAENELKFALNLISSEITIEKKNARGKGQTTIQFNHLFSSYHQVIKLIIKNQNYKDNSTKIYLPEIDKSLSFEFDENGVIEIDITDYISTPLKIIDFNVNAVGPKAEDQELTFEFYGSQEMF